MAIRSRPTPQNDRQVLALIEKGGTVATTEAHSKTKLVQLRPEEQIITRIDSVLSKTAKHIRPSRHAWLIQAIVEKLERDE